MLNLATAKVLNPYRRKASIYDKVKGHTGEDVYAKVGTKLMSPISGIIVMSRYQPQMGWTIYVEHKDTNTIWVFAHLKKGEKNRYLTKGEYLCTLGQSGSKAGRTPHLHWEILTASPINYEDKIMERLYLPPFTGYNTAPKQFLLKLYERWRINPITLKQIDIPRPDWLN